MQDKFKNLQEHLKSRKKQGICLSFSGGIDSNLLLYLCKDLDITAVTLKSDFQTEEEIEFCIQTCKKYDIRHEILEYNPFSNPVLTNNPKDRCYHCKKIIFSKIKEFGLKNDIKYFIDGTNYDDLNSYRPGLKALKELGINSPFAEFEITKKEIREYAKILDIENYDKPSTPCYATRFPYDTELNIELIEAAKKGEKILKSYGFSACRFRIHKDIARIEIPPEDFAKFIDQKDIINESLQTTGIRYITLDTQGLRSGSMD